MRKSYHKKHLGGHNVIQPFDSNMLNAFLPPDQHFSGFGHSHYFVLQVLSRLCGVIPWAKCSHVNRNLHSLEFVRQNILPVQILHGIQVCWTLNRFAVFTNTKVCFSAKLCRWNWGWKSSPHRFCSFSNWLHEFATLTNRMLL